MIVEAYVSFVWLASATQTTNYNGDSSPDVNTDFRTNVDYACFNFSAKMSSTWLDKTRTDTHY